MTSRKSTSSKKTERSKGLGDVVELGRTIVKELGLEETTDTLSRWMCHRIAELMHESENARTKGARGEAAAQCSELVLRLWERRSAWPRGWPPPSAASVLENLGDLDFSDPWRSPQRSENEDATSWMETFSLMQDIQSSETEVWREAALAEIDVEDARDWVTKHGKQMESEEREALEDIIRAADLSRERERRRASFGGKKMGDKQSDFAARLRTLASRRSKLMKQAISGPKPLKITPKSGARGRGQRRKPSSDD